MTFPLLPIISSPQNKDDITKFSVVGHFLFPYDSLKISKHFLHQFPNTVYVNVDISEVDISVKKVIELLNNGIKQVFVNESQIKELVETNGLPSSRFAIKFKSPIVLEKVLALNSSFVFDVNISKDEFKRYGQNGNRIIYYQNKCIDQETANRLAIEGYIPIISSEKLTTLGSESNKISISSLFTSTLITDRPDGLFTTLVISPPPSYTALGVVYSSVDSIKTAIMEGKGIYQSRKNRNELWYKGKTSGATQVLIKLEKDCDSDVVKFIVEPRKGYGFCHLDKNFTCFNDNGLKEESESFGNGLIKLDNTLAKRYESAPNGSYTKRLFYDKSLLIAKLKEELDELIEAEQKDNIEIAWEAADLIYFIMVWCIKHGIRLADIERNLDIKSSRVTRRKGDAKSAYTKEEKVEEKAKDKERIDNYKMEIIYVNDKSFCADITRVLTRPVQKTADIMKLVLPIIQKVQKEGDKALLELTAEFDGVTLESPVLFAPFPEELMDISDEMKAAINLSMSNIEKFHTAQLPKEKIMTIETAPGVLCSRFAKPIENVGLYVPGGTAVLPSTAMMLGIPAKVAGCSNIIIASPPSRSTGKLTPEVIYVAHKLGAKGILMAGGAQAISAMAYGTESVLKCDKILGPGNQFVTAAKMYVQNDTQALCSIDMPAGPSEVLVIADNNADPDFVASDLLSQAEHGVDSQVILIGVELTEEKLNEIENAIKKQAEVLPRKEIVVKCLAHSSILLVDSYEQAFKLSNKYAPEHLILQIDDAQSYVPNYIENAGSVFVGSLTPESCGDYSSGTNHTLPTYGYARQYSGVNTATFQKFITSQHVNKEGLKNIGKAIMTIAAVEGLEAHRNAIHIRMEKLGLL